MVQELGAPKPSSVRRQVGPPPAARSIHPSTEPPVAPHPIGGRAAGLDGALETFGVVLALGAVDGAAGAGAELLGGRVRSP